jgi:hypothetical protein
VGGSKLPRGEARLPTRERGASRRTKPGERLRDQREAVLYAMDQDSHVSA